MNLFVNSMWEDIEKYRDVFEKAGHHIFGTDAQDRSLPEHPEEVEGMICYDYFHFTSIENFPNLKYIQMTSAGYDFIPVEYIKEHGIKLHNARGVYSVPMAEHAVAGVLALYRKIREFYEKQKQHAYCKRFDIPELYGKEVCIIGCGSIGNECAKRFGAFGCHVTGVNRSKRELTEGYERILPFTCLDEEIGKADIIILSLPLNGETRGLMSRERIGSMKKGSILVNIARGPIVDTGAFTQALAEERICGVLDVFDTEPLPADSPLWDMENLILTPHNSWYGEGNEKRMMNLIFRNLGMNEISL